MDEFEIIRRFFSHQTVEREDTIIGIGDDAAVVRAPPGMELVITADVLVAGTHFTSHTDPASIGYKSLAVNLSDLAAMGATPAWFTLTLSLPTADGDWLEAFSRGLLALALEHGMQLIGGDTVRGPLSIGIQAHGFVPAGRALRRRGASPGDKIYVTGTLGDAGLGLMAVQENLSLKPEERRFVLERLNRPAPRVCAGLGLRGAASSCIDISDGLIADLGHILEASGAGAQIRLDDLPVSSVYRKYFQPARGWDTALTAGDDYELCFTMPRDNEAALEGIREQCGCDLTCIGEITARRGLRLLDASGEEYRPQHYGYDHFRDSPAPSRRRKRNDTR